MNKVVRNNRYIKLKNIYSFLKKYNLIEYNKLNLKKILNDFNYLNEILFKSYTIFNSRDSVKQKVSKLSKLKDPNGKYFLDEKISRLILKRYKKPITNIYKKIYSMKNNQSGGYDSEEYYKDNKFSKFFNDFMQNKDIVNEFNFNSIKDLLYNEQYINSLDEITTSSEEYDELVEKIEKIKKKINDGKIDKNDLNYLKKIVVNSVKSGIITGPKMVSSSGKYIFEWIFFPLYRLERLPGIGPIVEAQLDFIGIIIDNGSLITQPFVPLVPKALDLLLTAGSAIPFAGSAFAAAKVPFMLAEEPLVYLLENGLDILGLFINVQRKEFGLAYLSALEVIPGFSSLIDALMTNMYIANKHLKKGVTFTEYLDLIISNTYDITEPILDNPDIILNPNKKLKDIILPKYKEILEKEEMKPIRKKLIIILPILATFIKKTGMTMNEIYKLFIVNKNNNKSHNLSNVIANALLKSNMNSVNANDLNNAFNNKNINIPEVKTKQLDKNKYNISNSGQIFTPKTKLK